MPRIPAAARSSLPPTPAQIGLRLRALRRERRMTLAQCAQEAGLDKGFLSRVERGEKSASVGSLHVLAGVLNVPLSVLLGEFDPRHEVVIVRADERPEHALDSGDGGHRYAAISPGSRPGGPAVMLVQVGSHGERAVAHHAGEETIFVLEGQVQVRFGEHTVLLARDDSVRFPGYLDHSLKAVGEAPARALVVIDGG
ncbi:cupin domain-containing protein [Achromobacter sp. GG226]|uniref:helix-turn-helix domain-containing protein n=1 Tax=Verticiella alkaliphila TaxID=2779529 RepID=UPI001C0ACD36|nr:cupin domain-containing protein [Verticiella sp. GG226]MBU4611159.1 cupin domain-containing protein [Verticiella sp. GG226]